MCVERLCTGFLEGRGGTVAVILQGTEGRGSRVCGFFVGRSLAFSLTLNVDLSNTVPGMTRLTVTLKTAWTLGDVDGELAGVEEKGRVVGNVELLFFAQQLVALLCDAVDQAAANGTRQLEVLSLRNLDFVTRAPF